MKKSFVLIAALVLVLTLAGAGCAKKADSGASGFAGVFTFGGSTTVQPIANSAIEQFVRVNPNVKITYEGLGSSTGLKQLAEGTVSLAGSSRDLKQSELDLGLVPVVVAKDALAVVVNKDIRIANLTREQLAGIFSGQIKNWNEVGGADEVITVVTRDETSGTYGSFKELALDPFKVAYTGNAIVAKENGEVAAKVAGTPGAIGYVGLGFVEEITKAGGKSLSINGIAATVQTATDMTYPLARNLYMATKGPLVEGSVEKAFVDFVLSARGKIIVREAGFVPVN